jgi:hypothetical protein
MGLLATLVSGAGERGRGRRRGFVAGAAAVTIAVAAGAVASQGAAALTSEPSSSILAKYALDAYPVGPTYPTGVCHPAAPQTASCDSFLILLALKRPARSVVVSFDGLSGKKLMRPKVPPGTKWPSSGVPLSTGTFFSGEIPTVSLLKSKNAGGSGTFPAVGKPGYGTFHALITLSNGKRITTDFRAYLKRGWR